jgi:Reverse transcriptase (RNA-dependent DNA polymerase)
MRMVAKEYSQTYSIDYDETFALVAKMDIVRILVLCDANFNWLLHQLDVNNIFLHGDLKKEVYMELPSRFITTQSAEKMYKLKKLLYCWEMILT